MNEYKNRFYLIINNYVDFYNMALNRQIKNILYGYNI